ncbi:MAG: cytidylate kinase family protein [Candidatus Roizmanbacteria bacterium]|nr:cytidylate kinase family protein [Candidatus Roizmanbacteria bacterium]
MKYKNIAISGRPATGTSTLAKNLFSTLGPSGWVRINVGDIQREFDRKRGFDEKYSGSDTRDDQWERDIEEMTLNKLKNEEKLIYEAWLAGFVARELGRVLRVLLVCKDELRIDRLVNRDQTTVEQAKRQIQEREGGNIKKWKKLYGDYDFWSPQHFNLVIDTYSSGPMETVGKVLDVFGYAPHK